MLQGRVVEIRVSVGDTVAEGDELLFIESMKMEVPVNAPAPGLVKEVPVLVGDAVTDGMTLVVLA